MITAFKNIDILSKLKYSKPKDLTPEEEELYNEAFCNGIDYGAKQEREAAMRAINTARSIFDLYERTPTD